MSMLQNMFKSGIQAVIENEDSVFFGGPMIEQMFDMVLEYRQLGLGKEVLKDSVVDVSFEYDRDTEAYRLLGELNILIETNIQS